MSNKPVTESVLKHQSFYYAIPEAAECLMKLADIYYYYSHVRKAYVLIPVPQFATAPITEVRIGADELEWIETIRVLVKSMGDNRAGRIRDPLDTSRKI